MGGDILPRSLLSPRWPPSGDVVTLWASLPVRAFDLDECFSVDLCIRSEQLTVSGFTNEVRSLTFNATCHASELKPSFFALLL